MRVLVLVLISGSGSGVGSIIQGLPLGLRCVHILASGSGSGSCSGARGFSFVIARGEDGEDLFRVLVLASGPGSGSGSGSGVCSFSGVIARGEGRPVLPFPAVGTYSHGSRPLESTITCRH